MLVRHTPTTRHRNLRVPSGAHSAPRLDVAKAQWPPSDCCGDFFECLRDPDGNVTMLLGDVCGNGPPAAPLAAQARTLLRPELGRSAAPAQILERLNDRLERLLSPDLFVTAVAAHIDVRRRVLRVASAGHLGGFVRGAGQGRGPSRPSGPPLGILRGSGYGQDERIPLEPGDLIVFATDGVTDRFASADDPLGTDGVGAELDRLPALPAVVCRRLLWAARPAADATVVALKLAS